MKLTSPAFSHGTSLPDRFTCEHGNVSPPLTCATGMDLFSAATTSVHR